MTTVLTRPAIEAAPTRVRRHRPWALPLGLGAVGFLATFIGSWIPSFWGDEAASVMSAERSLPSLFSMLRYVDAVHGVYYLFLHFWILEFGASELSVRLPSAIAVGAMVAGVFVLGRMLAGRNLAIAAALIAAVLPRTSYMGADARSYALSAAIAVWATVLLLAVARHRFSSVRARRVAWLAYAVVVAAGIYLFLYLGLIVAVHGAFVLTDRRLRRQWRTWVKATAATVLAVLPIVVLGYLQRGQIAFLATRGYATANSVLVGQWFGNPVAAGVAWGLIALAVVGAVLQWRSDRSISPLVRLSLLWTLVPITGLLALNAITPAYNLRYVSFCIPGVALALASGIWMLRQRYVRAALVVALMVCAIPTDIKQRGPYTKDGGSDIAQTAALIGAEATPGDAVVFDGTVPNRMKPRLGEHLFPTDYRGLKDVELQTYYADRPALWDATYPLEDVSSRLAGVQRVWVIEIKGSPDYLSGDDIHALEADGYRLATRQVVHRSVVYSLVRK